MKTPNPLPFTESPGYQVAAYGKSGQTAIVSPRGCVALMNAGSQSVREQDAARIVATVEMFPQVLEALKNARGYVEAYANSCAARGLMAVERNARERFDEICAILAKVNECHSIANSDKD